MEWVPIVFFTFKIVVLGIGMFYAIKWHYDQGKKNPAKPARSVLRVAGAVALGFVLLLAGLLLLTFIASKTLGLELALP
ncbi:hypothetical protein [Duganella fentianensis]|uniref:hypothetical protein n=1 Tax=Duganella fentianensis TaxID=2692177 RepID=UPI0032B1BB90